ncbi:MAG: tetratricopeptide repeat protein [Gaiellaceae bacterium]
MTKLLIGGAAAVIAAAALLLGGVASPSASQSEPVPAAALDRQGNAFAQHARETGDATYYAKAEGAYRQASELAPNDLPATIGLGAVALSRHEFRHALALGRRAVRLSPSTARGYGVVGDALLELGRYEEAFETFNRMVTLKPSVGSYARISYARELLGDIDGAAEAMSYAIDAAAGEPEALAWSHTQLGKLLWAHRRPGAFREYRAALAVQPRYVYALEALAAVETARGDARRGIELARRAADGLPLPQFVATLGDLLHRAGRDGAARRQYRLVAAIARLQRSNGVKVELEEAAFDLDHGINVRRALDLARAGRAARPSIDGDDILAWALVRNGRCGEALHYSNRALRLGTLDRKKFVHRAAIERCLGNHDLAAQWSRRAAALR